MLLRAALDRDFFKGVRAVTSMLLRAFKALRHILLGAGIHSFVGSFGDSVPGFVSLQ